LNPYAGIANDGCPAVNLTLDMRRDAKTPRARDVPWKAAERRFSMALPFGVTWLEKLPHGAKLLVCHI
jgi:hypothetical protein